MLEKSNPPKISVLIPVYNVEKYVERCLLSILNQTMQEGVEVIIVNDCTPDRSMDIIREMLRTHQKENGMTVRLVEHERNRGAAAARNTLMENATGDYTLFVDSDDYVEPDTLEKMYAKAVETDADIVMIDVLKEYIDKVNLIKAPFYSQKKEVLGRIIRGDNSYLWNKLIRRLLYVENSIGWTEGMDMSEDYGVMVPLCYYANKIEYAPDVYYHYVQYNPSAISKRKATQKEIDGWLYSVKLLDEFIREKALVRYDLDIAYRKMIIRLWCMKNTEGKQQRQYANLYPELNAMKKVLLQTIQGKAGKVGFALVLSGSCFWFNMFVKTTNFFGRTYI